MPERKIAACLDGEGIRHGPYVVSTDGVLLSAGNVEDDGVRGTSVLWDEGRPWMVSDWAKGEYSRGMIWNSHRLGMTETVFEEEAARSVTKLWYDSGHLKTRWEETADEIDARYESWYESGSLRTRGHYHSGKRVGDWECWDETGNRMIRVTYAGDGTLLDWTGNDPIVVEWMQGCLQGCPGERINELAELDPGRRCDVADSVSGLAPR